MAHVVPVLSAAVRLRADVVQPPALRDRSAYGPGRGPSTGPRSSTPAAPDRASDRCSVPCPSISSPDCSSATQAVPSAIAIVASRMIFESFIRCRPPSGGSNGTTTAYARSAPLDGALCLRVSTRVYAHLRSVLSLAGSHTLNAFLSCSVLYLFGPLLPPTVPRGVDGRSPSRARLELVRAGPGDRVAERDVRILDGMAARIGDAQRVGRGRARLLDEVVVCEARDTDVRVALDAPPRADRGSGMHCGSGSPSR